MEYHKHKQKQRHGCLTIWLVTLMTLYLVGTVFVLTFAFSPALAFSLNEDLARGMRFVPTWVLFAYVGLSIIALTCTIALFQWKKWGFWGLIGLDIVGVIIFTTSFSTLTVESIFLGLGRVVVRMVFFYGILQIGKENKGWPQLD